MKKVRALLTIAVMLIGSAVAAQTVPPVLAPIGPQSVNEGASLVVPITATDGDVTIPVLTTSVLPPNASFVDNLNGTGTFTFNPDFTQAASINVTFYATDAVTPADVDSEIVVVTVNNVNQTPILAPIGAQSTTENVLLSFGVSASDPDLTTPTLTTSTLPLGALFTDNGNGTGSFSWTPGFTQSGTFPVTFFATDAGLAVDSEAVVITVTDAGNQTPVLATIGPRSTTENVLLSFSVSATDVDATTPALTTSTLPLGALFTDNGNGTGSFSWTPGFTQAGTFPVTFFATDAGLAVDSEAVVITVTDAGNQTPVLAPIGAQSTTENVLLSFSVSATDVDATTPTLTTSTLPLGALFTDNGNGTGSFSWTPGFTQSGTFPVTFFATDAGLAVDSEAVVITVTDAGNQTPVLAAIGPRSTTENVLLSFSVSATDVDATTPTLTTSTLPLGALFTDNGNGTGSFSWTPGFTQSGVFPVTFFATDAGLAVDSEAVVITVTDAGNQTPVLATIGPRSTTENVLLSFSVSATDADATTPTLTTSTLPLGALFTDNGNGTGSFSWTPGFTQAGTFPVTFFATDASSAIDSEAVVITVTDAGNQTPILAAIGPRSTTENVLLSFSVSATDVDATTPTLTTSTLPLGALFTDNGNGTGSFSWTPGFTQAGTFPVTFFATDASSAVDSEAVVITVTDAGNQIPVLATIGPRSTTENVLLSFSVSATDADATTPTLTTSTLPLGALFTDNGNGTGSFSWTPSVVQSGTYPVTFFATDAGLAVDSEAITITVADAGNQAPVLATIGPRSTTENVLLSFSVSATDPDLTTPTLTTSTLPLGALFTDNGNGTGSFSWTPGFTQAGTFPVTFFATDAGLAVDSEAVVLTVTDAGNQTPVLATIGPRSTTENVLLSFSVSATDVDATTPALTTSTLPLGASFTDNGNGTGSFSWTPGFTQAGTFPVTFFATDAGLAVDSEAVVITVTDAGNQTPVLAAIGNRSTTENVLLSFSVSATDVDATTPALTTSTLPLGASFTDNGNGNGSFSWTPGFTQSGVYPVTFYATDASLAVDSEAVTITVNEVGANPPVLAPIGARNVNEGVVLSFGVSATDADLVTPVLSATNLPVNASFVDNLNGTGQFTFTPDFTQAGIYLVTFFANDGVTPDVDSEVVIINVANINQPPVLATIGARSVTESNLLTVNVSASDGDGTIPVFTTSTLPIGALFTDNGNGTGVLTWTPGFLDAGVYSVTFRAADDSAAVDSEVVAITVLDAGNQLPVLNAIGPRSIAENALLSFAVSATDAESTPSLSTSTLPLGASFVDNGNGTGSFSWTPGFTQAGVYPIIFRATDAGLAVDSEAVTITVTDVGNQLPVLAVIGTKVIAEGILLSFGVSATDAEGVPTFTTSTLPLGASFVDNLNGTGTFNWTPNFTQSGNYNIVFRATDAALAVDSESVLIVVSEPGNQAPTFTPVSDTSVNENDSLMLTVTAVDADGGGIFPSMSVNTTLGNYTFVDNGNGTGSFKYKPTYNDGGIDTVRFIATDFGFPRQSAQEISVITTAEVNQPPTIDSIGPFGVKIGDSLVFIVTARDSSDASGQRILLTASGIPTFASFTDNLNSTGRFRFKPIAGMAGDYTITFFATDQGTPQYTTTRNVLVRVLNVNQPPVLANIGPRQVREGNTLNINLSATDVDGPFAVQLQATGMPNNSSIIDNGNGTGVFTFTPAFTQAGLHSVTIRAFDGASIDKEVVLIQVLEAGNQIPVFDSVPAPVGTEGAPITGRIRASDPDGGTITITVQAGTAPSGFTLADSGNGLATFSYTPFFNAAGTYNIGIIINDGTSSDTSTLTIIVADAGNQVPFLNTISNKTVTENILLSFTVAASDADSTIPIMSTGPLPSGASFTDNSNGTGLFTWTPGPNDSGLHVVAFYATDALFPGVFDSQAVNIVVRDTNRVPLVGTLPHPAQINEGQTVTINVFSGDPDGQTSILTAYMSGGAPLVPNMTFVDNLDGTGVFTFTPNFSQGNGNPFYFPVFRATDSRNPLLFGETGGGANSIRVMNVPQPPAMTFGQGVGPFTRNEGDSLVFGVVAVDPDGSAVTLVAQNLPPGATFLGVAGSRTFRWLTSFTSAGVYNVRFIATDATLQADTQDINITINESGNQAPIFSTVLPAQIDAFVGSPLTTAVRASDPDLGAITLTALPILTGAAFVDSGTGGGTYFYTPVNADVGTTQQVRFIASDGVLADTVITSYRILLFMRGDSDGDLRHTLNDVVYVVNYLFRNGPAPTPLSAGDSNKSNNVNINDVTYMVNYLYKSGPRPPE